MHATAHTHQQTMSTSSPPPPASTAPVPSSSDARSHLRTLISQKDSLESQISILHEAARTEESLVDREDFPRSDLDVHAIRNARAELARVQTDHKSIMRQIESAMFAVHAEAKAAKLAANPNAQTSVAIVHKTTKTNEDEKKKEDAATIEAQIRSDAAKAEERAAAARAAESAAAPPAVAVRPLDPFYRVASVAQDSPAEVAGLKPNDLVLQFGSVSKSNYSPATMASVVSSSIGRAIPVLVDRDGKRKELRLIPQAWGGRGMLGCHLVDI